MAFIRRFLRRPQTLFLRRCLFQVHLWLGVILTIYLVLISVSGSILVFRSEIDHALGLEPWPERKAAAPFAPVTDVVSNLQTRYRGVHIISITAPTRTVPVYTAVLQGREGRVRVGVDARSGEVLGRFRSSHSPIDAVEDLHVRLFAGRRGRMANGIGGALLLLLACTGLLIWWPGINTWRHALVIDFRRRWRRLNFDIHRAVGFWAFGFISFWAVSGIYFGFPRQFFLAVNSLSPIITARPPVVPVKPVADPITPDLGVLLAAAHRLDPGTTFGAVNFPFSRRAPFEILMRRGNDIGYEYIDTLYFNPWDGSLILTWRYGVNQTLGDWFIWLQIPLHFGTYWGLPVKILWALVGLAIPVLATTGLLMYWNRTLRHKWKSLKTPVPVASETAART